MLRRPSLFEVFSHCDYNNPLRGNLATQGLLWAPVLSPTKPLLLQGRVLIWIISWVVLKVATLSDHLSLETFLYFTPDQGQCANLYLVPNAVEAISLGTALFKMHLPKKWPPNPGIGGPSDLPESECITQTGPVRASLLVTGTLLLGSGRAAEALLIVTLQTKCPEPTQLFPPSLLPKTCWKHQHLSNMPPSCSGWLG